MILRNENVFAKLQLFYMGFFSKVGSGGHGESERLKKAVSGRV